MRKIYENVAHSFKEADEFDVMFWKKAGSNARFSAAWLMIKDRYKMRGKNGSVQRLRRSVQNIKVIKG